MSNALTQLAPGTGSETARQGRSWLPRDVKPSRALARSAAAGPGLRSGHVIDGRLYATNGQILVRCELGGSRAVDGPVSRAALEALERAGEGRIGEDVEVDTAYGPKSYSREEPGLPDGIERLFDEAAGAEECAAARINPQLLAELAMALGSPEEVTLSVARGSQGRRVVHVSGRREGAEGLVIACRPTR
jgi:hypothetical protein